MDLIHSILVVEDEMVVAMDLGNRLRKLGFDVCDVVPSGGEALLAVERSSPDLVLMDICLQGEIDGIETVCRMREKHDIPVVYLTANSDETTLARAKTTHPAGYLLKPFKDRELQIALEMALVNHQLELALKKSRDELEQRVEARTAELAAANAALREEVLSRRRAEEKTQRQAELLDKAQDAILVRTLDGRILYWNPGASRIYGYTESEARKSSAADLLCEVPDEGEIALRTALSVGDWAGEMTHCRRDGSEIVVESRWTIVRDSDGVPESVLIVNTDVTEKKRIETQFFRAQRLESVGALASGIAHDLNNVFTPLLMAADTLSDDFDVPKHLVEMISGSARRGAEMVRQILLFARGTTGERVVFRIEHLVKEVHHLLEETVSQSVKVTYCLPPKLSPISGDTTQIHQVLMNLCVNARDAMPDGGKLTISLDEVDIGPESVPSGDEAKAGRYVRVTISDTGAGIPAGILDRIFEPFFTTKAAGRGTGLGLSTVRKIVRAHGGFIDVQSTVGEGTEISVYFPVAVTAAMPDEEIEERVNSDGAEGRILIVDDERSVLEIVGAAIEAKGYNVIRSGDGAEALRLFAGFSRTDLVITDLDMREMGGVVLAQKLLDREPGIPILFMSGSGKHLDDALSRFSGVAVTGLLKPFTRDQLIGAVERAIDSGAETRLEGNTSWKGLNI